MGVAIHIPVNCSVCYCKYIVYSFLNIYDLRICLIKGKALWKNISQSRVLKKKYKLALVMKCFKLLKLLPADVNMDVNSQVFKIFRKLA